MKLNDLFLMAMNKALAKDFEKDVLRELDLVKIDVPEDGYSSSYQLVFDGVPIGEKINIPKDMVVEDGDVKTCTVADNPIKGYIVGDKYIDLTIANSDNKHIYILVTDLIDLSNYYTKSECDGQYQSKSSIQTLSAVQSAGALILQGYYISGASRTRIKLDKSKIIPDQSYCQDILDIGDATNRFNNIYLYNDVIFDYANNVNGVSLRDTLANKSDVTHNHDDTYIKYPTTIKPIGASAENVTTNATYGTTSFKLVVDNNVVPISVWCPPVPSTVVYVIETSYNVTTNKTTISCIATSYSNSYFMVSCL